MPYHVYLVEDHPFLRQIYAEVIDASDDLRVAGAAGSAVAALAELPDLDVDVAVVDVSLGGPFGTAHGIDLVVELHRRWPAMRVLVVSGHDETLYAERAVRAGARGYLMKHEAGPNLLPAIHRVLAGDVALSDRMLALLPDELLTPVPAL
jgi:DNA-binding NarL/FixJ family response regulator